MRLLLPEQRPLEDLLDLYDPGRSPSLRAGFVVTTDGGVSWEGGSRGLQTPADAAVFSALRAVTDAVVVGAGTARSEGYGPVRHRTAGSAWRAARGLAAAPLVLVSRSSDLDPGGRAFTGDVRPIVLTCAAARPTAALRAVADVVVAGDDHVDLAAGIAALHGRGLTRLLCEGGPSLLTALLRAGLVDELCLTLTPLLVGAAPTLLTEPLLERVHLELAHLVDGGGGTLLARYLVGRPPAGTTGSVGAT